MDSNSTIRENNASHDQYELVETSQQVFMSVRFMFQYALHDNEVQGQRTHACIGNKEGLYIA